MKLVRTLARRFLVDRRGTAAADGRGFVSFISAISMAGLALGVTALLVVTSVMNGFERELKSVLSAFHGHIILFSPGEPVSQPQKYLNEIPKAFPNIKAVSPYVFAQIMLSSARGISGAYVEGIDPESVGKVTSIPQKVVAGRLPAPMPAAAQNAVGDDAEPAVPEVTLAAELARKLRVGVDDTVVLTIPFAGAGEAPLVRKLKVVGIIKLGYFEYDAKYALMNLGDLQQILGFGSKVNAFKILTADANSSQAVAESMTEKYTYPLRARDWSTLNRNLFYAIRLEKVVISIILMAIVLVASFNIISTILMMVHDKKRQIAMLKALGFRPRSTMAVFLLIGAVLSVLGTVLGLGVGRALCAVVEWKSIIDLPADVYFLSRLPVEIRAGEWIAISVLTVALAVGSTLVPSYRVSRESPVEGLRYE